MADLKISQLTAITTLTPATDVLPVVDVTGTTKKITTNQILGSGGTATLASATISGDLTVDTSTLKVDSTNNRVGIGTASPLNACQIQGTGQATLTPTVTGDGSALSLIDFATAANNGGMLILGANTANGFFGQVAIKSLLTNGLQNGTSALAFFTRAAVSDSTLAERYRIAQDGVATWSNVGGGSGTAMTLNSTGLGIGVTPSAWSAGRGLEVGAIGNGLWCNNSTFNQLLQNAYFNAGFKYAAAASTSAARLELGGGFNFFIAPAGTAGNAITFTQAMTLDASGNLLAGATSGTSHNLRKQGTTVEGDTHLNVGNAEHLFFACSSVTYNAAAAAYKITRNSSTLRSINAGGTVNASGADYAEYMVKCSNFVLAKGDVAGIDANGKLTNVFADAISFVVKSTDPSYVGNDKWGVDLEGDTLEAARQLVDRIAFAGQVPVNVTGANAGDYIVPVVDGTGIKGISVSNPTFEQYQLAVGKVIAIDADGRARIIVKVA